MTVPEMLNRLFQLGLSQAEIAEKCDSTQPTISRAAKGAQVRYELGKAIEELYRATAAQAAEEGAGLLAETSCDA